MSLADPPVSTFASSLEALRSAQKGRKGAPPYSLFVNRPFGRYLAAAAHAAGLRPNQVTGISAAFTFTAIALLALGPASWWLGVIVAVGLVLGYALDSADGQLARLRGGGTLAGEWLDHTIDSIKVVVLHLGVAIMLFRSYELSSPLWLLVPLAFAAVSAVHFFGMIVIELLGRIERARRPDVVRPVPVASLRTTMLKLPTDYGVLCLSFTLIGAQTAFLGLYSLLASASAGYLVLVIKKWYGDVRQLDLEAGAR
jgi:phosphatidylglycerophosphate synthase